MPTLFVNGQEVEFQPGMTVLQACELAGEEIPRFCYHERLAIAGNCRMCLVQIEGGPPKPAASCAMPAAEGMKVHTNTPMVKSAREGVMEFLLINHPLDCPICDQGGECDLQDQAMAYGRPVSSYNEGKRAVKDKYMGPLVKTHMTRCIHCTRCVRFLTDVAGVEELGAIGRGEHMEISTYVESSLSSELSANIIDLCPVGALTSKPYAYHARPWELRKTESIDVLDAVGSAIRIDARGREVMRVLPRLNEEINEEWISDKTRYACDGLKLQRLDRPYVRRNGHLQEASWEEALAEIAVLVSKTQPNRLGAIVGDLVDCEAMTVLKEWLGAMGSANLDCRQDGSKLNNRVRASYLFNTTIAGIEKADACLLIGADPRNEAAMLNARLRKRSLSGKFPAALVGEKIESTFPIAWLGNETAILSAIADGSHPFCATLEEALHPIIILGSAVCARPDGAQILAIARKISERFGAVVDGWNGFNVLHRSASRVGGLDLAIVPDAGGFDVDGMLSAARSGNLDLLFLLGADELDVTAFGSASIVYLGHHGDRAAHRAQVILPVAAYTEKSGTYVNLEGRVQRTAAAVSPPGEAKEEWEALVMIAKAAGVSLPFANLSDVRARMEFIAPHLAEIDNIHAAGWFAFGQEGEISSEPFTLPVENFYMTDPISRASRTMAACQKERDERENRQTHKKVV
jgi:NADH-quinone oxidoreductase subunit G